MAMAHRQSVTLGDTVGNNYSVVSGLKAGDKVIVSGTQFLVDGMPVMPLGGPPGAPGGAGGPAAQNENEAAPAQTNAKLERSAMAKASATIKTRKAARPVAVAHPHRHKSHPHATRAQRSGHATPIQIHSSRFLPS